MSKWRISQSLARSCIRSVAHSANISIYFCTKDLYAKDLNISEQAAVAFVAVSATNLILTFSEVRTGLKQTICMKFASEIFILEHCWPTAQFEHAEPAYASRSQSLKARTLTSASSSAGLWHNGVFTERLSAGWRVCCYAAFLASCWNHGALSVNPSKAATHTGPSFFTMACSLCLPSSLAV